MGTFRIMIIDDELAILDLLTSSLQDEGYDVVTTTSGKKALEILPLEDPDVILCDICLPEGHGLDLLEQIIAQRPHQKVFMISGYGTIPVAVDAVRRGAVDFIEKPIHLDEILHKLSTIRSAHLKTAKAPQKTTSLVSLVGTSPLWREIVRQLDYFPTLHEPLLIYGPSGSGKTHAAHYMHAKRLGDAPFVHKNCASLTPAQLRHAIEQGAQGTVYLHHVEDLIPKTQQMLIASLDEGHKNFMLSACQDLFGATQDGRFMPGLFYRLHKATLGIPALVHRVEDIASLALHFLSPHLVSDCPIVISPSAMRLICSLPFPGNVAELKNLIACLALHAQHHTGIITPVDFAHFIGDVPEAFVEERTFQRFATLDDATQSFQKNFLLYLLKKSHYNLTAVAKRLGMEVPILCNYLHELNISMLQPL